jgi:hypothetical protein
MILILLMKRNGRALSRAFSLHNKDISKSCFLHLLSGSSQKASHTYDIDIHKSAFFLLMTEIFGYQATRESGSRISVDQETRKNIMEFFNLIS